jgi:transcriptional regulator with XRE-family HTH domain
MPVKHFYSLKRNTLQAIAAKGIGGPIAEGYTHPVSPAPTVGKNVAALRKRLDWSQSRLAEELRMRQPAVSKIEQSPTLPKTETLLRLAKTLRVSVDVLLDGVDPAYDTMRESVQKSTVQKSTGVTESPFSPASEAAHAPDPATIDFRALLTLPVTERMAAAVRVTNLLNALLRGRPETASADAHQPKRSARR